MMTLIRLFLQKQSEPGLHCLSSPFWQASGFQSFRTSIVIENMKLEEKYMKHIVQSLGYSENLKPVFLLD